MKEQLVRLLEAATTAEHKRLLVREYLQVRLLGLLQELGAFQRAAFLGGTALRFLFGLPRFSEDLDFSTTRADPGFPLERMAAKTARRLSGEGYEVAVKTHTGVVASCFLRFPSLLHELKLSPHPTEVISVKLEVDTNPPGGAVLQHTLIRRHGLLNLLHYDRPSLLAGKLHAVLARRFTKGRDLYDLLWYLADPQWPPPNLQLLNNALEQTSWGGPRLDGGSWRRVVAARLEQVDWAAAVRDVRPFLERQAEAGLLTREHLLNLLKA
jgi:predicted nucleotidyltransferase component of viral defense system